MSYSSLQTKNDNWYFSYDFKVTFSLKKSEFWLKFYFKKTDMTLIIISYLMDWEMEAYALSRSNYLTNSVVPNRFLSSSLELIFRRLPRIYRYLQVS